MIGQLKASPALQLERERGAGINKMQLGGGRSALCWSAVARSLPPDLLSCRQTGRVRTLGPGVVAFSGLF